MIDLIMGLFGGQVGAIIAGVIGIAAVCLGAISGIKTNIISKQKKIISSHEASEAVLLSAISTNEESLKLEREANEILASNDHIDDVLARMRDRAAARDNADKG